MSELDPLVLSAQLSAITRMSDARLVTTYRLSEPENGEPVDALAASWRLLLAEEIVRRHLGRTT